MPVSEKLLIFNDIISAFVIKNEHSKWCAQTKLEGGRHRNGLVQPENPLSLRPLHFLQLTFRE
jgi:hypothetical protein